MIAFDFFIASALQMCFALENVTRHFFRAFFKRRIARESRRERSVFMQLVILIYIFATISLEIYIFSYAMIPDTIHATQTAQERHSLNIGLHSGIYSVESEDPRCGCRIHSNFTTPRSSGISLRISL